MSRRTLACSGRYSCRVLGTGHVGAKSAPLIVEEVEDLAEQGREHDANTQARTWVLPSMPAIPERVSASWIDLMADLYGIAPIVLIGQLQKRGVLPWRTALVKDAPNVVEELRAWA